MSVSDENNNNEITIVLSQSGTWSGTVYAITTPINDINKWYHVLFTKDGTNLSIYINYEN